MRKYRIIKIEYADGHSDYRVQRKCRLFPIWKTYQFTKRFQYKWIFGTKGLNLTKDTALHKVKELRGYAVRDYQIKKTIIND